MGDTEREFLHVKKMRWLFFLIALLAITAGLASSAVQTCEGFNGMRSGLNTYAMAQAHSQTQAAQRAWRTAQLDPPGEHRTLALAAYHADLATAAALRLRFPTLDCSLPAPATH